MKIEEGKVSIAGSEAMKCDLVHSSVINTLRITALSVNELCLQVFIVVLSADLGRLATPTVLRCVRCRWPYVTDN